jgi:Flp pilus assembly protein TadD
LNQLACARATHAEPALAASLAREGVELKTEEGKFRNALGVALYRLGD